MRKQTTTLQNVGRLGLIAGGIALSLCMIGLVESFDGRDIVSERFTLGQLFLFGSPFVVGFLVARKQATIPSKLGWGTLAGGLAAVPIFLLILLTLVWETIRDSFINVSADLITIITLANEKPVSGVTTLLLMFAAVGLLGAAYAILPDRIRAAITLGLTWAIIVGMMSDIFINILRSRLERSTMDKLFGKTGLNTIPFVALFLFVALLSFWWRSRGHTQYERITDNFSPTQAKWSTRSKITLLVIFTMILPSILGVYLTEILNNVGLYILMGLGLNIAVGMAGLLDLGYVTNFAVGAYLMALLTSGSDFGLTNPISFWLALPICVVAAMFTGFIFALPVLRMRGDYLAIATLGFGEIIRVLVKSDAMKWLLGGAQGILQVPKASISGFLATFAATFLTPINTFLGKYELGILNVKDDVIVFGKPPQLFYLIVLACLFMLFVARRLNNSRIGRRWLAIREDEDVAAAMGINTTNAKVIAFTLSAASGGLAGALFAAKLGSIYPSSFQILISINVLCLIIVGGLGSIPGIVVGAFALIGVPELLREFAEFRILFYGIALVVMMLIRPEGLWPSEVLKRELQADEEQAMAVAGD